MIGKIINFSLRLHFLIITFTAVLIAFGIMQLREMPIDVYPEFDPPMVEVQTEALGLSAAEVEAMITVPLEANMLNGVAWLDQIYSESVAGMSSIRLIFEPGTDPIRARQMVQERLSMASHPSQLPNVSRQPPTMIQPLSTTNRVLMVGLSSKEVSLIDMGVLARWNIKPRLMGIPGVANVAIWGNRDRQLQVQVDPNRLQENHVTVEQIVTTAGEALWVSPLSYLKSSTPGTSGFIDTPNQRFNINHRLPISTPEDLAKVPIAGSNGLLLSDVTSVVEDHQPLIGDAVLNNSSGLLLVVEKLPGANTLEVTRNVERTLDAMQPGLTGIEIDTTVFRPASYIETAAQNISTLLLISFLLLMLFISIFLGWRTAVVSLVAIPVSLITSIFILYLRGESFNMILLTGLMVALGVIIDDVIVDIDTIARRLRQKRTRDNNNSTNAIIIAAVLEMRSPIIFATLIILLITAPLLFMPGLSNLFFQPLVVSYILAVLASLTVTLVLTPALSLILLPNNGPHRVNSFIEKLESAYSRLLSSTVRTFYLPLILTIVTILIGIIPLPFLKLSVVPTFKQTNVLISVDAQPNTSLPKMKQILAQTNQELLTIPGIRNVSTHIGRAITGDQAVGINSAQIWIGLDPATDYDATVSTIRDVIAGYSWFNADIQTYQPKRLKDTLEGVEQDLVVRVYGQKLEVLDGKANEIRQSIAGIDGIAKARVESRTNESQVEITVDLAATEHYETTPGEVRRQATTLLSGLHVGNLYEEQKIFDVIVWGTPEIRGDLTAIRDLLIETPKGQIPLGELAEIHIAPSPIKIKHDKTSRFVDLHINVHNRSPYTVAADIRHQLKNINFPFEYHAEVLGSSQEQQATQQRLLLVITASVLGCLLLFQATYLRWRLALVTLLTLSASLVGGIVALFLSGGNLSLGALFGLLTIVGIAVRNEILMVNRFQHLHRYEGELFGQTLVLRGARDRMRPILLSTIAIALVFLPFAFSGNIAGNEITHAMAIVILGGLVTSTVLSLFVLPALYLRFGPRATSAIEK